MRPPIRSLAPSPRRSAGPSRVALLAAAAALALVGCNDSDDGAGAVGGSGGCASDPSVCGPGTVCNTLTGACTSDGSGAGDTDGGSQGGGPSDAGGTRADAGASDAGTRDGGADAGRDAGPSASDAGTRSDAGATLPDAGDPLAALGPECSNFCTSICAFFEQCGKHDPGCVPRCGASTAIRALHPRACAAAVSTLTLESCPDWLDCGGSSCDVDQICIDLIFAKRCMPVCDLIDGTPACSALLGCQQVQDAALRPVEGYGACPSAR